jgi:formylglycine-generating enzyme required for sulfatase activity
MPPKFFITHSWKDIEFARRLTDDLSARGLDGFFDAYSIQPGDNIPERIARGLETCDVYVPMLSPTAVASRWSELEINTAITLERNHGHPRIIPVIVESCAVPVLLQSTLHINFAGRYNDALIELLHKGFGLILQQSDLQTITITQKLQRAIVNPKDAKEMILIPAGDFLMGSDDDKNASPTHKVYVDSFYIARHPVTNTEYGKFVNGIGHPYPQHWKDGEIPLGKENHPVVYVTWEDAVTYAKWAECRLPTEVEWEKAARGVDGRRYPWGNEFDVNKCNVKESEIGDTSIVGKYSPQGDSPYGVADMLGNVAEWCSSRWGRGFAKPRFRYPYLANDGRENSDAGDRRIIRGQSWSNVMALTACSNRDGFFPINCYADFGFRTAKSVSP